MVAAMGMKGKRQVRLLERFKNWWDRTPEKRGLDVGEVFYRLSGFQRFMLVILCVAVYCLFVGGVFTSNVLPHYKAIINADGSINAGEITSSLTLTAGVLGLTSIPLILKLPISLFSKLGIIITSVFIIASNITNACGTQTRAREARNDAPRQKIERIHRLDAKIKGLETAWQQVPAHEYVTAATVKTAEAALEALKKSADEECHKGVFGNTRGPKCEGIEKKRDAKAEEVEKLQRNADLTDRASNIEAELYGSKKERDAEGATPDHIDAEMETFTGFLALLHVITPEQGKVLAENKPILEVITMELQAAFLTSPTILGLIWVFGLMTCHRGEADRRMVEIAKSAAEERAKVVLSAVPHSSVAAAPSTMEPDHSEEAVLGIEGEELPAFAQAPRTVAEATAAALLKADPNKQPVRKARTRKTATPDSVKQWFKERIVERVGRNTKSQDARADYEAWCSDMNVPPVNPTQFGLVLKNELGVEKEGKSGRIKYLNIGLRPAALRVVA